MDRLMTDEEALAKLVDYFTLGGGFSPFDDVYSTVEFVGDIIEATGRSVWGNDE